MREGAEGEEKERDVREFLAGVRWPAVVTLSDFCMFEGGRGINGCIG